VVPGNPGTARIACNLDMDASDFDALARFCHRERVDLVVVGPENPLALGIADFLRGEGIDVFGPGKKGAMLESSKGFAKDFLARHGIPHPRYRVFDRKEEAMAFLRESTGPFVIKADGLAFGKGVSICHTRAEASSIVEDLMSGKAHGEAGKRVVIEEYLTGVELTAMALFDGHDLKVLPFARDHKRLFDGDEGPMTGGMGAFSPVPSLGEALEDVICREVLEKTAEGLKEEGIDYRGVIYAGLMLTKEGPKVLEYNVRFGDPEAQCVLPLLQGDFGTLLAACARGRMSEESRHVSVEANHCVTVVMASGGYPGTYRKGLPILGLDLAETWETEETFVFHAGTKREGEQIVTAGGRVLAVTGVGSSLERAREKAYRAVETIKFDGAHYRKDIAIDRKAPGI